MCKSKIVAVFLILLLILSGCAKQENTVRQVQANKMNAVWFSFSEIDKMLNGENFEDSVKTAVKNLKSIGADNVFIHIRSHADSIFRSDFFPLRETAKKYDFDIFEYIVTAFKNEGINVHAWINPYRILTGTTDKESLDKESKAYIWLSDSDSKNDKNVCVYNGFYYNPAEVEVQKLILDGVREVINNYGISGIVFDDYFYPTTDSSFDKISYENYKNNTHSPLSLADWRRSNVNSLMLSCKAITETCGKKVTFAISPAADIKKNYDSLYADIEYFVKNGCVDYIIPQIYFGFEYPIEEFQFENLKNKWKELATQNGQVKLIIALATYKIASDSETEWQQNSNIIARQVEICYLDSQINGFSFFSYSSLFSENEANKKERENLFKIISKY